MSYLALAKGVEARLRARAAAPPEAPRDETNELNERSHGEPTGSPGPLGSGAWGFAAPVATLLGLPLDAFAASGQCLEVRVPWHAATLWFVPANTDAEALVATGVNRGRIWTRGEVADLLAVPGITTDQARQVALAKLSFDGDVALAAAPPAAPEPCYACKGRRWWRSVHGMTVCATCHPPASPELVSEWLCQP